jgi:hypothetical protein
MESSDDRQFNCNSHKCFQMLPTQVQIVVCRTCGWILLLANFAHRISCLRFQNAPIRTVYLPHLQKWVPTNLILAATEVDAEAWKPFVYFRLKIIACI